MLSKHQFRGLVNRQSSEHRSDLSFGLVWFITSRQESKALRTPTTLSPSAVGTQLRAELKSVLLWLLCSGGDSAQGVAVSSVIWGQK